MKNIISMLCIAAILCSMIVAGIPTFAAVSTISATFEPKNDDVWSAEGTLTITNTAEKLPRYYLIRWGNKNGALEGYSDLGTVKGEAEATFKLRRGLIVPTGADRLLVFEKNGNTVSDDYVEALLPAGAGGDYGFGEALFTFNIMSDIHINKDNTAQSNKNFIKAITEMITANPDVDGIFVNGDIAEWGESAEYQNLHKIIENIEKETGVSFADKMHYGLGNHDYYKTNTGYGDLGWPPPDPTIPVSERQEIFLDGIKSESDTVYFDGWVDNMHYIFLADEGEESDRREVWAQISDEQFEWLEDILSKGDPTMPVFIFLHQGIKDTVAGTKAADGWHGIDASDTVRLKNILADYPEVIMFAGHSHWTMEAEDTYLPASADLPAMFNTASMKNISTSSTSSGNGAQAYYVTVYEDKLVFSGRDIYKDRWISNAQFVIDWDYDIERIEAPVVEETDPPKPTTPADDDKGTETNGSATTETIATEPASGGCKSFVGGAAVATVTAAVFCISLPSNKKRKKHLIN